MNRAEKRYHDALQQSCATSIKRTIGRPSTAKYKEETAEESMLRRSQTAPYDKTLFVKEQKEYYTWCRLLHQDTTCIRLLNSFQIKVSFRRLNSISAANDATANDVQYRNLCWAKAKRSGKAPGTSKRRRLFKNIVRH